ncbi:hypothetical protein GINT2_000639 [Glugoides intestinalis]
MFECALFGISKQKLQWNGVKFNRIEKTYLCDRKKVIVGIKKSRNGEETTLTFYEQPDRNKQRISITRQSDSVIFKGDYNKFLTQIGYSYVTSINVEGYAYHRNGYVVEISRLKRKVEIVDSSEEEAETADDEIPECLFNTYLVKAFALVEKVNDGEHIINMAFQDLNDTIKLIKPDLNLF